MARPRAFDETEVLRSIEDVFWRRGYDMTSYEDLMRATGLGKGSLYAAFGDKQALYLRALTGYIQREIGALGAILMDKGLPGLGRITALFDEAIQAVETAKDRRGCFLCNAAVDQAQHDPDVAEIVADAMNAAKDSIKTAIADSGPTRANADGLLAAYLGMRVLARAGADVKTLKAAKENALLPFQPQVTG